MSQKDRIFEYIKHYKNVSKYDMIDFFWNKQLPDNKIAPETICRRSRELARAKKIQHPDFFGVKDETRYEIKEGL